MVANKLLLFIGLLGLGVHLGHCNVRQEVTMDRAEKYVMGWEIDTVSKNITFDVRVKTTGFIGFGLAPLASMRNADMFIGGVYENGTVYYSDRYSYDTVEPIVDNQQDWEVLESWEDDGETFIKFRRALETCDPDDVRITADTLNVIWSFGETDDLGYHGTQRGGRQFNLFDPPEQFFNASLYEKWEVRVNDVMHAKQTSYLCTIHKLKSFDRKMHMIALEAYLGDDNSIAHTHHFTATGCDLKDPEVLKTVKELSGQPGQECYEDVYKKLKPKCNNILFGWAVGGKRIVLPEDLGVPVGETNEEEQYVMFEVHYDNPEAKAGIQFVSGFNVYFTDVIREKEGSVIMIGVDILPALFVPPNTQEFTLAGHCSSEYTQEFFPPEGIQVVSVNMHSHLAGRRLKVRHFRDGKELPWLLSDDHYDFDYQQTRELSKEVTLKRGDQLTMECVMSTIDRVNVTMGGESTHDEMCHVFLFYYPKIDLVACRSFYPLTKFFSKFGIIDYDEDSEILNPTITRPKKWNGKLFSEIANQHTYTPRFVSELQQDLRYGEHIATYVLPAGAGQKKMSRAVSKFNKTTYPIFDKDYAVDSVCPDDTQANEEENSGHVVASSVFFVFTAAVMLTMFKLL